MADDDFNPDLYLSLPPETTAPAGVTIDPATGRPRFTVSKPSPQPAPPDQSEDFDPNAYIASPPTFAPMAPPNAPSLTASPDDKYRAAAIAQQDQLDAVSQRGWLPSWLDPLQPGYTERVARGAGMGWTDELMAAGGTPFEMIRHGTFNPVEGYRYAKARENLRAERLDQNTAGKLGMAAQVLGGLSTGAGVLGAGTRLASPVANYFANVGKGAGLGAFGAAGESPASLADPNQSLPQSAWEIGKNAMLGGVFGGVTAGLLPVVPPVLEKTLGVLQVPRIYGAIRGPAGQQHLADKEIAQSMRDAGVTGDVVAQRVAQGNAVGQPFTVADAIGDAGQRKLAGMAKVPGPQRDEIKTFMDARDLNQPARTSGALGQALGVRTTAEQAQTQLQNRAAAQSRPFYRAAENSPAPIWSPRLQEFLDAPIAREGLARGVRLQEIENVGANFARPTTSTALTGVNAGTGMPTFTEVPNFRTLNTLKIGLDKMIEEHTNDFGRLDQEGAAIVGFKNRMLAEMDRISPVYRQARAAFADPMQVREAVQTGRDMVSSGRAQDNLLTFNAMRDAEKQGARIGVADVLQGQLEKGEYPKFLRQKSEKGTQTLDALSLHQGPRRPGEADPLRQYLNREETMSRTSRAATGGSSTMENAADVAAQPSGHQLLGLGAAISTGNPIMFGREILGMAPHLLRGESEKARIAITKALLERDPAAIAAMNQRIADWDLRRRGVNPWTGTYRVPPTP